MTETEKFLEIVGTMPRYIMDFFVGKTNYLPRTKLAYAMDLHGFFCYVLDAFPDVFPYEDIRSIPLKAFDGLRPIDISYYLNYESEHEGTDRSGKSIVVTNGPAALKRKLAAIRSFYKYFYKMGDLTGNPASLVDTPKLRDKEIVILNEAQQERMLFHAETGDVKTPRAQKFHNKTMYRDLAVITLMLGTGLRVSEVAGLDMGDINLDNREILVTRKGAKRQIVPFNGEVEGALRDYLAFERGPLMREKDGDAKGALFVSSRGSRITVRRLQQIVEQYSTDIMPENYHISPHVLRKTYGTKVYREHDIYTAKEVLGHSSIETTSKYYAKFNEEELEKLKEKEVADRHGRG